MNTSANPNVMTFAQPGHRWNWFDHFVHGNGRLGVTAAGWDFGDRLRLNENTIWSRSITDYRNPLAPSMLPRVRELLEQGRPNEAECLAATHMMGVPRKIEPYQMMGNLFMHFHPPMLQGAAQDYRRILDLTSGCSTVTYTRNGTAHRRTCFAAYADEVVVWRHACTTPNQVNLHVSFHRITNARAETDGADTLIIEGRAGSDGTRFCARVKVIAENGRVICTRDSLAVEDADAATIFIAMETDYWEAFRGRTTDGDYRERAHRRVTAASDKGFPSLLRDHTRAFSDLYHRSDLVLEPSETGPEGPANTDANRHFNVSKYLTISSSREGELPSNLQGLWCDALTPEWNCDYHTNINIQMNYWIAEGIDLGTCHRPLLDWIRFIAKDGGIKAARDTYDCDGWVLHHLGDPWGFAYPGDEASAGMWAMGGAWCCLHLWEHFQFNGDTAWLREEAFPVLRGAVRFFRDFCYDGADGYLETSPSVSPENGYVTARGEHATLCVSPTMDHQILRALCKAFLEASVLLDEDPAERAACAAMLAKLRPTRIAANGTIMEWREEVQEVEPGHRHIAHLFGLHPADEITREDTPELVEAARRTIRRRLAHDREWGDAGFTFAWAALFFARTGDGDDAWRALDTQARTCTLPNYITTAHGILTIDAAFGFGAAVVEMLVQSHEKKNGIRRIRILPALPRAWARGACRTIKCRGGHRISIRWERGAPAAIELTFGHETQCLVYVDGRDLPVTGERNQTVRLQAPSWEVQP